MENFSLFCAELAIAIKTAKVQVVTISFQYDLYA